MTADNSSSKLIDVVLDEATIGRANAMSNTSGAVAIFDLIEENSFHPVGHDAASTGGEYRLHLGVIEQRLVFTISDRDSEPYCHAHPCH